MNLQAYANHRKAMGLRGQSHVAVLNAINDGRLTPPAVERHGRSWVINAELADEQWAARTDLTGGGEALERPIGPPPRDAAPPPPPAPAAPRAAKAAPAAPPPPAPGRASFGANGPSLAISRQVRAAYEAKLKELEFKERAGELVPAADVKREAFSLARALRDGLMRIPDRVAPLLAATTDARKAHQMLSDEIRVALRGLGDG